jgi:predicted 2-oxoglutarate/Fe(II)-dependent dioxygenase YbiX
MYLVAILVIIFIMFYFMHRNRVFRYIPNVLTPAECQEIIKMSEGKLEDSTVYNSSNDKLDTNTRISKQCWLDDSSSVVNKISERASAETGTSKKNQELLQVVRYTDGGFFTPHYDACKGDPEYCKRMNAETGIRYVTFLVYLNDDFEGGNTVFPKLGKSVKPKQGDAILFYNTRDGQIIDESFHGGDPVIKGTKWICNKWIRTPN